MSSKHRSILRQMRREGNAKQLPPWWHAGPKRTDKNKPTRKKKRIREHGIFSAQDWGY